MAAVSKPPAKSAEEAREDFKRAFLESRAQAIGKNVRCLVCANQSIEDSDSEVAIALRRAIRVQLADGKSDEEVRDHLVEQFGDYVLYAPPFDVQTALLWLAPITLLASAGAYLAWTGRRRPAAALATPGWRPRRLSYRAMDGLLDGIPLEGAEVRTYRHLVQLPPKRGLLSTFYFFRTSATPNRPATRPPLS